MSTEQWPTDTNSEYSQIQPPGPNTSSSSGNGRWQLAQSLQSEWSDRSPECLTRSASQTPAQHKKHQDNEAEGLERNQNLTSDIRRFFYLSNWVSQRRAKKMKCKSMTATTVCICICIQQSKISLLTIPTAVSQQGPLMTSAGCTFWGGTLVVL